MRIRTARDEDWPEIHSFYSRIVDEGRTYTLPEGSGMEEARSLWMGTPSWRTVVAVDGERIAGTAKAGPSLPGRGSGIAGASFMVNPEHRGAGVGRALG
ncbi:GNAT family N-acetyltransferase, partial [Streptomyces calidiresistens]